METLIQETVDSGRVPGISLAVVHEGEVVCTGGFGVRDTATGEPVDADTVFQIASLSKPISSTALAGLVGKGLVGWDDLVIDHLPDFRFSDVWATNEVTIRDCFCHRTGLPGSAGDDLESYGFQRPEILHRLRYLDLASSPRSTYAYSNFGMTLGRSGGDWRRDGLGRGDRQPALWAAGNGLVQLAERRFQRGDQQGADPRAG